MLDFQRELAITIAGEIHHRLSEYRLDLLTRRHTANTEAFQLYLQGLHAWNQLKPPQTTHAIDLPHAARADCHLYPVGAELPSNKRGPRRGIDRRFQERRVAERFDAPPAINRHSAIAIAQIAHWADRNFILTRH